MSNPQEVQFGSQPPTNAEVAFGNVAAAEEVTVSEIGNVHAAVSPDEPSEDVSAPEDAPEPETAAEPAQAAPDGE